MTYRIINEAVRGREVGGSELGKISLHSLSFLVPRPGRTSNSLPSSEMLRFCKANIWVNDV